MTAYYVLQVARCSFTLSQRTAWATQFCSAVTLLISCWVAIFFFFFFPGKRVRSENNSPLFCSAIAMPTVFHSECCCLQAKQREKRQTTLFCLTVSSIFSCQVLFASFEQNIKRSHEHQIPVQYSHYCLVHAVCCCLLVSSKTTREAPSCTYLFNSLIPYSMPSVVACLSRAKPPEKHQATHMSSAVSFLIPCLLLLLACLMQNHVRSAKQHISL